MLNAEFLNGNVIDGKKYAQHVETQLADMISWENIIPCLAILSFGNDPASAVYIRNKVAACNRLGIRCHTCSLPENNVGEGMRILMNWATDSMIHGIIVQLPAPESDKLLKLIPPYKDVDGLRPDSRYYPCTAKAIRNLIPEDVAGKHAVIVGRSNIVGKPVAKLLLQDDATVTVCHSKTKDLEKYTRDADILIVATGKANLIKASMVKPGATVIDVGINRVDGKLVGDVDYAMVKDIAGYITSVPGGVGPVTVAMLMSNTVDAAMLCREKT